MLCFYVVESTCCVSALGWTFPISVFCVLVCGDLIVGNRIGGLIVSVLSLSAVDHGFEYMSA